ncbi:MAG: ATP-dependent helicase [Planctomycetota bacterium]
MHELLQDLTAAQREAVAHVDGPLLVVAGAGSGKTRVVTRRVAYLIARKVPPSAILAITFTNKAANEMAERIAALTGSERRGPARVWVSTFHSFCARLLRRYAPATGKGLRRDFTILDDADQRALMRDALVRSGSDPKMLPPAKALYGVERLKDRLLSPAQAKDAADGPAEQRLAAAYELYQESLEHSNAVDFSDLLFHAVGLLRQDEVREQLEARFRYLLIDEYQDTNHAQYQLARLLAQRHGNLCATGDPDQSIYGWRGADVGNILGFQQEFPAARVVRLEENFRSTQLILDAANGLIARNQGRHQKVLRGVAGEGLPVEFTVYDGEYEEADAVAARIGALLRGGADPEEIGVLYRIGALSRSLETALRQRGIDHRVVGSVAFYQRREVKDVLAYLRLVQNPHDEVALQRVINVPPRGVGKRSQERVVAYARATGCSVFAAARELAGGEDGRGQGGRGPGEGEALRSKKGRAGLAQLVKVIDSLRRRARLGVSLEELVRDVLGETRYRDYVHDSAAHEGEEQERLGNLEALCAAGHEFDKRWKGRPLLLAHEEEAEPAVPEDEAPKPAPEDEAPEPEPEDGAPVEAPLFAGLLDAGRRDAGGPAGGGSALRVLRGGAAAGGEQVGEEELQIEDLGPAGGIAAFLEHTALVSAAEEEESRRRLPKVSLMTIHAAKGLEFEAVFLVGWEEGLFPHSRALSEGGEEEERRLAYVAITRAKRRLWISRARWRRQQGHSKPQDPSSFLAELPGEAFPAGRAPMELERGYAVGAIDPHDAYLGVDVGPNEDDEVPTWARPLQRRRAAAGGGAAGGPGGAAGGRGAAPRGPEARRPAREPAARGDLDEVRRLAQQAALIERGAADAALRPGERVYHEHFGRGVVLSMHGRGTNPRATIEFESHGKKMLVLQYARMRKLGADEP